MRTQRREPDPDEPTRWEAAGWDSEPRNGREWAALKEGQPQPGRKEHTKKCRKCGSKDRGVYYNHSRKCVGSYCVPCRARRDRETRLRRPDLARERARRYRLKQRETPSKVLPTGEMVMTFTAMRRRPSDVYAALGRGQTVLVEIHGDPAGYLVPVEQYEAMRRRKR